MKTISIKGKPYVPVSERLNYFLNADEYAGWRCLTEILEVTENWVVMIATVTDVEGNVRAVGHDSERREGHINKTSYVENCETSAVGRALGFLGIGSQHDIASADEVALARDAEPDQIAAIENLLISCSLDDEQRRQVEDEMVTLTYVRAEKCIAYLLANQRDPIASGDNYNQGDIHKKLTKQGA